MHGDPWLATISLETQTDIALGGTINVVLAAGTGYTVGSPDTAVVNVIDGSLPEISLSNVPDSVTQGHDFKFTVSAFGNLGPDWIGSNNPV